MHCFAFSNVLNSIALMENFTFSSQDFWIFSCIYYGKKCEMHRYASYHCFCFSQLLEERPSWICMVMHFEMFWTPLHWWKTWISVVEIFWIFASIYSGKKCEMHGYASLHYFHFFQLLEERNSWICIVRDFQMFWTPFHWWKLQYG